MDPDNEEPAIATAATLRAIAARLIELANSMEGTATSDTLWLSLDAADRHQLGLVALAQAEINGRRQRASFIDKALLGEPAWDMLLGLFTREGHGRDTSVLGLCSVSGTLQTEALRWLEILEAAGMIERIVRIHDQGDTGVRLTDRAKVALQNWLSCRSTLPRQ